MPGELPPPAAAEARPEQDRGRAICRRIAGLSGVRADLAAIVAGALAALALPPWHLLPTLPVAVAVLFLLIEKAPSGARGVRRAARRGYWFGFGYFALGLYWITDAILVRAASFWWLVPFAVPLTALGLAIFIAVPAGLTRLLPKGLPRVLGFAGLFTLGELARGLVLTGFPWNLWGSVWALPGMAGNIFIQPAAWVGVYGLSAATALVAGLPSLGRRGFAAALAILLLWAGAGLARLSGPEPPSSALRVALIQGDIPETLKLDQANALHIFEIYLRLTRAAALAADGHPLAVVWPEAASPYLLDRDGAARAAIATAAGPGVPVLAGSIRFDRQGRPRNSLIVVEGPGPPLAIYDKWHLVPFGEYQPEWLPLPIQVVPGGGFKAGPGPRTLRVPGLPPFGPLICYEAIFSGQIIGRLRPDWLVNITNDAWFGNTAGPRQHLAAARMRAVEEGLPLLRAANTGISAAFTARGREIGRLAWGRRGFLMVRLPGHLAATLYARFGLAFPALLAVLMLAAGAAARTVSGLDKS
ncbi:MAG: apolipoprotein N-acyltransferase [Acetobacteraceae bacterium]